MPFSKNKTFFFTSARSNTRKKFYFEVYEQMVPEVKFESSDGKFGDGIMRNL